MKITPIIVRTEEAIGRKVKQTGSMVANTYRRIPEQVRTSAKDKTVDAAQFVCGNILATAMLAGGKTIAVPVYSLLEHGCRLIGQTEAAVKMGEIKKSIKEIYTPEGIKEAYKMFDVPKSGEFWSYDITRLFKKSK